MHVNVPLDASSNPHLAASIGVKRQSSTIALAAPTDYRHDGDSIAENGNILKEKSRRMDSPERRPSACTVCACLCVSEVPMMPNCRVE